MSRTARGFTLLEVMVAVTLLAVGMALAIGSLRSIGQAAGRAEAASARAERLRAVQGVIRNQLSGALPISFRTDIQRGVNVVFEGDQDQVRFVSGMPGYLARGGPYLQTLALVPGANGKQLVYRFRQLGPDGPLPADAKPVLLLDGIADAKFEFQALAANRQAGPWRASWKQDDVLPPLVRLRLEFVDRGKRWPELVAAVRLASTIASGPGANGEPLPGDASQ
jgi:general secretion pathway protein J